MTENLALDYIKRRMHELGYGNHYHLRLRHLVLGSKEEINIKAYNSFFVLTEEPAGIHVRCQSGIFDLQITNINELKYEFHGNILIKNNGTTTSRVRFIQVTPYKQKQ